MPNFDVKYREIGQKKFRNITITAGDVNEALDMWVSSCEDFTDGPLDYFRIKPRFAPLRQTQS